MKLNFYPSYMAGFLVGWSNLKFFVSREFCSYELNDCIHIVGMVVYANCFGSMLCFQDSFILMFFYFYCCEVSYCVHLSTFTIIIISLFC